MPRKATTTKKVEETQETPAVEIIRDVDIAVEKRLVALYTLQCVDSEIDKIQQIRGELPQAVQDLEDEIAGLETRIENFKNEKAACLSAISEQDSTIAEQTELMKKYEKQQSNVRNNREFEAIGKEVEFAGLQIELCERKKRDAKEQIKEIERHSEAAVSLKAKRAEELQLKKDELDDIIAETEKDETRLRAKSAEQEKFIEDRYLSAYKRIRNAARNGLAVVTIYENADDSKKDVLKKHERACGGCFSAIPHQRQMEISMHKKVIVCEHCGRILVDDDIAQKADELLKK